MYKFITHSRSWFFIGLLALLLNGYTQNSIDESANFSYSKYQDSAYYNYSSSSVESSSYYAVQPRDILRRHGLNDLELTSWNDISQSYAVDIILAGAELQPYYQPIPSTPVTEVENIPPPPQELGGEVQPSPIFNPILEPTPVEKICVEGENGQFICESLTP